MNKPLLTALFAIAFAGIAHGDIPDWQFKIALSFAKDQGWQDRGVNYLRTDAKHEDPYWIFTKPPDHYAILPVAGIETAGEIAAALNAVEASDMMKARFKEEIGEEAP